MRDELHLMELVDRYLDGSMNEADRVAFEARAEASKELRQLIEDQRVLREGVQRTHLRGIAQKASPKGGPGGSVAGLFAILAIISASYVLWNRHDEFEHIEHGIEDVESTGSDAPESEAAALPDTLPEIHGSRTTPADTTWIVKQVIVPVRGSETAVIEHMADSIRRSVGADSIFIRPRAMHPDSVRKMLEGDRAPRLN
ncbi:MAG: hypothetical protein H6591_03365 [Flavobacteriales bacterium]|nr:hypothetical protein [Flavobacteriales bacterium]